MSESTLTLEKLINEGWRIYKHSRDKNISDNVAQEDAYRWKFLVLRVLREVDHDIFNQFGELTKVGFLRIYRFRQVLKYLETISNSD